MNRSDIRLPEETKDKGTPTEQIRSRRKSDCTEETKDKSMPTPSRKAVAEWKRRRDER
ncbi:hypothetical protein HMPREF1981_00945 [Bacteroides pyogenes F0041]|uniref:Uncharacterized protein n=1 Tax=Bacteroides pyogenes F0041 TaxID=1321819 RepID=U2C7G4_9BACE|nr:hypothetical protein HMPREF1981_00945 [Bacteroides pyogenes F0041]